MMPYREVTIPADGALSFTIRDGTDRPWWWYLDLDGAPLYLISNACGTCEAIFQRVRDLHVPLTPHEFSTQLALGLDQITDDVIRTVVPLLPKGNYIVGLIDLHPTRIDTTNRPYGVGCAADYYWWRLFHREKDAVTYELVLPCVAETDLDDQRIAWYRSQIQHGHIPTALALSLVDERTPAGRFLERALTHVLLDGHHKVMAASQLGQRIRLLSFLRETAMTDIPLLDPGARAYYAGLGSM